MCAPAPAPRARRARSTSRPCRRGTVASLARVGAHDCPGPAVDFDWCALERTERVSNEWWLRHTCVATTPRRLVSLVRVLFFCR